MTADSRSSPQHATGCVSVIIPTLNEARWIGATLQAVMAQRVDPMDIEIFVIDTGSNDATCDIIHAHSVALLEVPTRSSYVARNAGIERARGEYLVFLDADCVPARGWLEALLEQARKDGVDYVAGRIENEIVVDNLANRLLALRTSTEIRRQNVLTGGVAGGNMMIHRRVFERIGPFVAGPSGGDIVHSKRALDAGFRIAYAEKAIVRHQCDLSNGDYLARRVRIRRGQVAHAPSRSSVWRTILAMPWRPGFREAAALAPPTGKSIASLFAYLWLERWANYIGSVAGMIDRKKNVPLAA